MLVARILRWAGIGVLWVGIVAIVAFAQVIRVLPEVNFGQVTVGTTKSLEYVFTNPHNEQATINAVGFGDRFYGQDPPSPAKAVFEVAGLVLPTTLPPGGQFRFTIRFTPPAAQVYRPRNPLTLCVTTAVTRQHIHYQIPLVGQGVAGPGETPPATHGPFTGTTDATGRFEVPIPTLPNTGVRGQLTECTVKPLANQSFTLTLVPKGEMITSPEDIAGFTFSVPGYRETTVTQFSKLTIFGFTWYDVGTVCLFSDRPPCKQTELRVLTQNSQLIPNITPHNAPRSVEFARLAGAGGKWTELDIVCLQEVFSHAGENHAFKNAIAGAWLGQPNLNLAQAQWFILNRTRVENVGAGADAAQVRIMECRPRGTDIQQITVLKRGDRWVVAGPDSTAWPRWTMDGGLMILSKHPVIAASGFTFSDQAGIKKGEEMTNKGALYARIQLDPENPECYIHVFNTHLAAREPEFNGPEEVVDYKVNGTKGTVVAGKSVEVAVKPGQTVKVTAKFDTKVTLTFLDKDKKEIKKLEKALKKGESHSEKAPARAAFLVIATDVEVPHPDQNWGARQTQIGELVTFISNCIQDDKVGHPIILGGDFNVIAPFPANWGGDLVVPKEVDATKAIPSPQYDALMNLLARHKLTDAWKEKRGGEPGFTWLGNDWKTQPGSPWGDKGNPLATKQGWPQRLDYIFYNAGAETSPLTLRLDEIERTKKPQNPFQWGNTQSYVLSDHLGVIAKFNSSPRCNRQVQR